MPDDDAPIQLSEAEMRAQIAALREKGVELKKMLKDLEKVLERSTKSSDGAKTEFSPELPDPGTASDPFE